jgi:hypothetical protein
MISLGVEGAAGLDEAVKLCREMALQGHPQSQVGISSSLIFDFNEMIV